MFKLIIIDTFDLPLFFFLRNGLKADCRANGDEKMKDKMYLFFLAICF